MIETTNARSAGMRAFAIKTAKYLTDRLALVVDLAVIVHVDNHDTT